MRTIINTIEIYKFNELSDDAKNTVIENYRQYDDFHNIQGSEYIDSLNKFADITGITINNYSLGAYSHNYVSWSYDGYCYNHEFDYLTDLKGLRLRTWLINNWLYYFTNKKYLHINTLGSKKYISGYSKIQVSHDCPLTGCYYDHSIIDPILKFIHSPNQDLTLEDLINDCFNKFCNDYQLEHEHTYSEEYITEMIECNDYDFTIDGEIYQ